MTKTVLNHPGLKSGVSLEIQMKLEIEYCGVWNYLPRAASLAEAVKKALAIQPELIRSSGGVFEIFVDGKKIYSKKATGDFPSEKKIITLLKGQI